SLGPFSAYMLPYCGCPPRPCAPVSAPAPPRTPSHEDGWGGGVSLSPLLPFQAPAGTGRLLYLVQRLVTLRGQRGDRRTKHPAKPLHFQIGKILFMLLVHSHPPICRPGQGLSFLVRPGPAAPGPPVGPLSVVRQSWAGVWPPCEPAPLPGVQCCGRERPVAPG